MPTDAQLLAVFEGLYAVDGSVQNNADALAAAIQLANTDAALLAKLAGLAADALIADVATFGIVALSTPVAPVVTKAGTAGVTHWGYRLVARNAIGQSVASAETVLTTGNATLDGTNYNIVATLVVAGVSSYDVYRTTAAGTPNRTGLIGNIAAGSPFNDKNLVVWDSEGVPQGEATEIVNTSTGLLLERLVVGDAYSDLSALAQAYLSGPSSAKILAIAVDPPLNSNSGQIHTISEYTAAAGGSGYNPAPLYASVFLSGATNNGARFRGLDIDVLVTDDTDYRNPGVDTLGAYILMDNSNGATLRDQTNLLLGNYSGAGANATVAGIRMEQIDPGSISTRGIDIVDLGDNGTTYSIETRGTTPSKFGGAVIAGAYKVGATAGIDFSGAVTSITVVKGIVTSAS